MTKDDIKIILKFWAMFLVTFSLLGIVIYKITEGL